MVLQLVPLVGDGAPLAAHTAAIIKLPRAVNQHSAWRLYRAALPHSLASELSIDVDRITLEAAAHGQVINIIYMCAAVTRPTDRLPATPSASVTRPTDRPWGQCA
jgi:hypothetical protein